MRLELAEFPVASIKLADRFHYAAGQLTVDKSAIEQAVLQESRIEAAWLESSHPAIEFASPASATSSSRASK